MQKEKNKAGWSMVTVSDKGQIVVPAGLMREIGIEKGDHLFIIKREDGLGFTALKEAVLTDTLKELIR